MYRQLIEFIHVTSGYAISAPTTSTITGALVRRHVRWPYSAGRL